MTAAEVNEPIRLEPQSEGLKLFKMTKNYNWEIKLLGEIDDKMLKRLEDINNKMQTTYGGGFIE